MISPVLLRIPTCDDQVLLASDPGAPLAIVSSHTDSVALRVRRRPSAVPRLLRKDLSGRPSPGLVWDDLAARPFGNPVSELCEFAHQRRSN